MTNYIKPECMPHYYTSDGVMESKKVTQSVAYTADGYLLPCCWCDTESMRKDFVNLNMYDNNLRLANNDAVDDILHSEPWKKFINIIMTDYVKSPFCCREKCGVVNG